MTIRRLLRLVSVMVAVFTPGMAARAQLPKHPTNLQVLPKALSTDSVFSLMLGIADGLGVTCGACHVGGDNATWDSTNFAADVKPMKKTARQMLRLVNRLNDELIPAAMDGHDALRVTCMTCHRGAPRPVLLEDTIRTVIAHAGADSAAAWYMRIREHTPGRLPYDMSEIPLEVVGNQLIAAARPADATKILETNAHYFANSARTEVLLGRAYLAEGDKVRALQSFGKVLSITPDNVEAQKRVRELSVPPG